MQAWAGLGVAGAVLALAVITICEVGGRSAHPPGQLHWVSRFGARAAAPAIRWLFRDGLTVAAVLYGAFAAHALWLAPGVRAALGAGCLLVGAGALLLLARAAMDVYPTAHVVGATGYFVGTVAGAALHALPPHTPLAWATVGALGAGAITIGPLFAITVRHTIGRPLRAFVAFLPDETAGNIWVRSCQHGAVYATGLLLLLVALDS
jgi:hypothetical protein